MTRIPLESALDMVPKTDPKAVRTVPFSQFRFESNSAAPRSRVRCLRCGWTTSGAYAETVYPKADRHECKRTRFDYVRRAYGVPAARGRRVTWDGRPGRITSGAGNYIRIRLDEPYMQYFAAHNRELPQQSVLAHPTCRLVYHTPWGDYDFSEAQWESIR